MGAGVTLDEESGFALPSVLMLVLLLTMVALSVLLMGHLRTLQAVADVARVRAELAAQSGVARAATDRDVRDHASLLVFADSSSATVRTLPWGLFKLAIVRGRASRATATRTALLGAAPPPAYRYALTFGSASRQLILTGSSEIVGDLALGPMGATVGTLPGERQPPRLPVSGTILRGGGVSLPQFDDTMLAAAFESSDRFLAGGTIPSASETGAGSFGAGGYSDSTECMVMQGNVQFSRTISRREIPLTIYVRGDLTLTSPASIEGPVAFYVTGRVRIERGAHLDNTVLISLGQVIVDSAVTMRGQLIAPRITIGPDALVRYPSIVCSREASSAGSRSITLSRGVRCEGMVIMLRGRYTSQTGGISPRDLVIVDKDASIFGALHAEGTVTLDGTVAGTVFIEDLFFHHPPTAYYGWIRSARINRSDLPEGFAVPQALGTERGEVLLWM
ncbi:MAG: hypothetical protein IPI01_00310 [Ignavibacteriae bacterium]|nr:hypothetical protein [Ignavibacteriota bacterium]